MANNEVDDVIIIGGGPAGLAAGLYAARDRYRTLMLEKNGLPGGQIMLTERIENYPGYEQVTGPGLIDHMRKQVEAFGAKIATNQAVTNMVRREDGMIEVTVNKGEKVYQARAVILAPGSDYRMLDVPGEKVMRQAGKVSYCATCDGAFYRGKNVLTVGGGNTAVEDTIYLVNRFVGHATIIHRREEFRAQKVLVEEMQKLTGGKLTVKVPFVLEEIVPSADKNEIDHVRIRHAGSGATEDLKVDGVFVFVGMVPNTTFLKGIVEMNAAGYVACDPVSLKTSMPGVFVAGDCRQQAAMQLATASADGVVAAMMLKEYFRHPQCWKDVTCDEGAKEGW